MVSIEFKVKDHFLNCFLSFFSFFVPKDKKRILFAAGRGLLFKGNPKYLYLYFLEYSPEFEVYWITASKTVFNKLKVRKLPVIYKYSFKGFCSILKSYMIVIDFTMQDFSYTGSLFGRFNIVQTWHGVALKYIGACQYKFFVSAQSHSRILSLFARIKFYFQIREYKSYKFIIAGSELESNNLQKAFMNRSIKITGFPRNDVFLNKGFISFEGLNESDIKQYNKILSYIPTFRDVKNSKIPFSRVFLKELNAYLKAKNYLLVIKKHPHDKNFPNLGKFSNIKDISEQVSDAQELLVYTDILITDYSSVFFDYVLTNQPIIFYCYDYEEYIKECRGLYYNYYEDLPGPFAKNEQELYDLIKSVSVWFKNKDYQREYMDFKKKFHKYADGNSSERISNEIVKFINNN